MKKIDLGQTFSFLANVGVIVGIAFLVFELRQSQSIALSSAFQNVVANEIEIGNAIAAYSDIWVKGNRGEELTPAEKAVFWRLVKNLNDAAFFAVQVDRQLGLEVEETVDSAEFALFLHRSPGAYEIWRERSEDLSTYRGVLNEDQSFAADWRNRIQSEIEAFRVYDQGLFAE